MIYGENATTGNGNGKGALRNFSCVQNGGGRKGAAGRFVHVHGNGADGATGESGAAFKSG